MTPPSPPGPRSLPVLAGLSAVVLVVATLGPWVGLLLARLPAGEVPEQVEPGHAVFVVQAVAIALLIHLLPATWLATPRYQRRGIVPAAAGLVLSVVWVMVDDILADWRNHPWVQLVPELLGLQSYSALVANFGTTLIAGILLLVGAALLLTRPGD